MPIIQVEPGEVVLVHQRHVVFHFQVEAINEGTAHLELTTPVYFEEDGRPGCLERHESETLESGDSWDIEVDGNPQAGIEGGTVEIVVGSVAGNVVTFQVNVPPRWGAIREHDAIAGSGGVSDGD